ncbi:MAG: GDSL-type esterase/lipase family protein [Chitinophagaceae bacterium]
MLRSILLSLLVAFSMCTSSQNTKPPFWNEIQSFKKQDSASFPGTGKILFTGSSSFTLWKDVQNYFPAYPIINRGFGGSSLPDVTRYENDVIFPYQPKQIVIYCGENDIAGSDDITGEIVFDRFKQLFTDIRNKFPDVPVAYVSMKPSPSRWHLKEKMIKGNELISDFLSKQKNTDFINVWPAMLKADGTPMDDIFREDKLHMTEKGYAIWQKILSPI